MKKIALSGKMGVGKVALVDDEDYNKYSQFNWHLSSTGYAVRRIRNNGKNKTVRLHRLITKCPDKMVVDHLNGNKLDCRKNNLRICTQAENSKNRHYTKGYCYDKSKNKWMVRYKNRFFGRYKTEEEARCAYQLACSGQEYQKARRKYYMLPKHISKQFGKYVVFVQKDGKRLRKTGIRNLEEALSWRNNFYNFLEKED